ncbi:hypothetical protein [Streptomyces telluris]|uniref:Uncharacterized protein n=1 Tax=Streptomyces telluris TaxID=2720021 RepID=A0A9X2LPW4_9ACTN|nr:hypothetical protein [Streptomyces telluris]MCQ8774821.1 hypothetical protein [Streptomyces telluris]
MLYPTQHQHRPSGGLLHAKKQIAAARRRDGDGGGTEKSDGNDG